jgi:hypothetical protein
MPICQFFFLGAMRRRRTSSSSSSPGARIDGNADCLYVLLDLLKATNPRLLHGKKGHCIQRLLPLYRRPPAYILQTPTGSVREERRILMRACFIARAQHPWEQSVNVNSSSSLSLAHERRVVREIERTELREMERESARATWEHECELENVVVLSPVREDARTEQRARAREERKGEQNARFLELWLWLLGRFGWCF